MDTPAVSDTATDGTHQRPWRRPLRERFTLRQGLLLTALLIPLSGCVEEPLPRRKIANTDCLREVELDRIEAAIKRCDAVVAAFPADPMPLNERFILHSLNGDTASACRDITRAAALARDVPRESLDELLRKDLELRLASCKS
jgi:hypothetical protein